MAGEINLEQLGAQFTKQLEELGKNVQSVATGVDNVNKKSTILENRLESMAARDEDKGEKDDLNDLSGPKEIASAVVQEVNKTVEAKLAQERQKNQQESQFKDLCRQWDEKAFSHYPQLRNESSELYKEVVEELKTIHPLGYDAQGHKILPPDAVYNAAARVAANAARKGNFTLIKHEELEPGGNFQRQQKSRVVNSNQKDIIAQFKRYGINEERITKRIEGKI